MSDNKTKSGEEEQNDSKVGQWSIESSRERVNDWMENVGTIGLGLRVARTFWQGSINSRSVYENFCS
jgi:hypothetical protein